MNTRRMLRLELTPQEIEEMEADRFQRQLSLLANSEVSMSHNAMPGLSDGTHGSRPCQGPVTASQVHMT